MKRCACCGVGDGELHKLRCPIGLAGHWRLITVVLVLALVYQVVFMR